MLCVKSGYRQSGWSSIGCEGFHTNLNIPSPLPTTLVFRQLCWLLIYDMYSMYALILENYTVDYLSVDIILLVGTMNLSHLGHLETCNVYMHGSSWVLGPYKSDTGLQLITYIPSLHCLSTFHVQVWICCICASYSRRTMNRNGLFIHLRMG